MVTFFNFQLIFKAQLPPPPSNGKKRFEGKQDILPKEISFQGMSEKQSVSTFKINQQCLGHRRPGIHLNSYGQICNRGYHFNGKSLA